MAETGGLLDDTSHAIRQNVPFMPLVRRAAGASIEDLDGHRIVDYWQGHFANLLGHNPPEICQPLAEALQRGRGLQTGHLHEIEREVAELICRATSTESLRFTTSGTLATLYAMMLARAFTGRDRVLKVGGGWHGSQPFALKGVAPRPTGFDHLESEGLPAGTQADIVLVRFNDEEALRRLFAEQGDRLAAFIVEPVLGAGGGMAATGPYLRLARELTAKHGVLLVCDEIITGFRYRAGDLSSRYGVRPDLLVLGKIVGGGMPLAAVAGRRAVLELCTRDSGRVKFEGGTYSAHELTLLAARSMLGRLLAQEAELYPRLTALGAHLRGGLTRVLQEAGLHGHLLGAPEDVAAGGSLILLHVMAGEGPPPASPEELAARRHPLLDERLLKSVLLLHDVSTRTGLGALTTAHTTADVDATVTAYAAAFARLREAGLTDA
jgi:glutamate-1-semialdehyde 2,1-aminomutase